MRGMTFNFFKGHEHFANLAELTLANLENTFLIYFPFILMEQRTLKIVNNCLFTNIYSFLRDMRWSKF
jgi:hypothetical protein